MVCRPRFRQLLLGLGSDAPQGRGGQRGQEGGFGAGRHFADGLRGAPRVDGGFPDIGRDLGDQLAGGDPEGAGQAEFGVDLPLEADGEDPSGFGQGGDVQEGLVDGDLFQARL